jgi:predicted NBD/HSP70 family sugar kinase
LWTFGGQVSDFPDVARTGRHQFQVLPNGIVFFDNRGLTETTASAFAFEGFGPANGGYWDIDSQAIEYTLNETDKTATLIWDYNGDSSSLSFGDAKRLPKGNTLIVYSNNAEILEVDPTKNEARRWTWGTQVGLGYADMMPTH